MIKFEHTEVLGWEHAIRGMRNPLNSWDKSDSYWTYIADPETMEEAKFQFFVGDTDKNLMQRLHSAGTDHGKFMRMLIVYVDITAPLYWWKEFDTYKIGTVANSCSTMHKIHAKEFVVEDFSDEHLGYSSCLLMYDMVDTLNMWRIAYNEYDNMPEDFKSKYSKKECWYNMIQLLPTSYNQKRTVMLNYEVLSNMYKSRKNHKLTEWHDLCRWIEELPHSDLITE